MAIGIPVATSQLQVRTSHELIYEGKQPIEEVLSGKRASLTKRLTVEGDPCNHIIYSDNARALRSLLKDGEVRGKVRLIYIDPPFATSSRFEARDQEHAYSDTLDGDSYLEFLRIRLILLHELLAEDGSLFLHLDHRMVCEAKLLLDEIFGADQYRNLITRKRCSSKNWTSKSFGLVSDYILFYTKSDSYVWNQPYTPLGEDVAKWYTGTEEDTGRRFMKVPLHAPGERNGSTGEAWRGIEPPPGKHWQYTPAKLDELDAQGRIYWSKNGNPRRKLYLDERDGKPVNDIWLEFRDAHNQNIRITGYPTEKNPDLIRRIVKASSNKGDLVLDAFAGSGTTAAVAEELGRPWIAIDNSPKAIETMLKRLASGTQRMGDYVSGRTTESAPNLFDGVLESGVVVLHDAEGNLDPLSDEDLGRWVAAFQKAVVHV